MYSLVTMPGLAADLVRHRSAIEVVDVLDQTLRLDPDDVSRLAAAHRDDAARRRAWSLVCELGGLARHVPVPADAWPGATAPSGDAPADRYVDRRGGRHADRRGDRPEGWNGDRPEGWRGDRPEGWRGDRRGGRHADRRGDRPERWDGDRGEDRRGDRVDDEVLPALAAAGAPDGPSAVLPQRSGLSLGALVDCTREDLLGWTCAQVGDLVVQHDPGAVHAVTDALGAAWAGHSLPPSASARLSAPWRVVLGEIPVVAPADAFGPQSAAVRALVDRLATVDAATLGQLTEAYRLQAPARPSGVRPWDIALRRGCQAAFVGGRVREAAAAQLAAVRALLVGAGPAGAVDVDLAQVVAGTVQALVLRDQLDPIVHRFLVFAWEATVGPLP